MAKKKNVIATEITVGALVKEVLSECKNKYLGAEWTGAPCVNPEFGELLKGKIYPLTEERAKISDGFKPIYEAGNIKGEK